MTRNYTARTILAALALALVTGAIWSLVVARPVTAIDSTDQTAYGLVDPNAGDQPTVSVTLDHLDFTAQNKQVTSLDAKNLPTSSQALIQSIENAGITIAVVPAAVWLAATSTEESPEYSAMIRPV